MQFTAPVPIDQAMSILQSHAQEVPVLADTMVETSSNWQSQSQFSVKRRWKAKRGWGKYTVVELNGTLQRKSETETTVNARIQPGVMAFVVAAFFVLLLLYGTSNAREAGIALIAAVVIAVLAIIDAYVIYRIIGSLKKGNR